MSRRIAAVFAPLLVTGCLAGPPVVRHPGLPAPVPLVTRADQRAAFAQAYRLRRQGAREPALALFAALAARYPELVDYHLYFEGVLHRELGHDAPATEAFHAVVRDYPQSLMLPGARLELGNLLRKAGRAEEALPWLAAAGDAADASVANAARFALAEIEEQRGNLAAAAAGYDMVRRQASGTELAQTAKQRLQALRQRAPEVEPAGSARVEEARLLLREHDFKAAVERIASLLFPDAGSSQSAAGRPELLLLFADALHGSGDLARGLAVLRKLGEHYPDSAEASKALFRRATITWNRVDDNEALALFREFLRVYPRHGKAAEARYAIGRIHQQGGRDAEAIAAYEDLARLYPRTALAAEGRFRIGWIRYRAGSFAAAIAAFRPLATGAGRDEADYWRARSLEKSAARQDAFAVYRQIVERDPSGYYAMWGQHRLDGGGVVLPTEPLAVVTPPPLELESSPVPDSFHLQRGRELTAAGVFGLARREWDEVAHSLPGDVAARTYLLRAYQASDGHRAAIRLLGALGSQARLSKQERRQVLYPLAFWSLVRENADPLRMDPLLVEAVMRQESVYDPEALSPVGARGLLQLMPETARRVAESESPPSPFADLNDPEINVRLGTRYLHGLLSRFDGNAFAAVAAYNAGEAAVERWQRQNPGVEADEFVESITYRETRKYVKRVVANYRRYRRFYGGAATPSALADAPATALRP